MSMNSAAFFIPLVTLLTALAIVFDLAQFRFPKKKLYAIVIVESVIQLALSTAVLLLAGLEMYAKWYVLITVLPAYATFFYISKNRDARDIFTIVTTILISFILSIPAMWFYRYHGNSYLSYNLVRIALFGVIFALIHFFFRKPYLIAQEEIDKGWGIFSILPFLGSCLLYYEFLRYGEGGDFSEVLYVTTATVIVMASVYTVNFYMVLQLHDKYLVLEQKRILTMQNKAQMDQHLQFKDDSEKTNRRWHDLRHGMQYLTELLEEGNTGMAIEYLKEQMSTSTVVMEQYCQHPAVNSILSLWSERSRNENISMQVLANIPKELDIEPVELSALFANAIENAYYSCLALPDSVQKFIKVEAIYNGKRLAIGITNSCSDEVSFEGDMPVSAKEGGGIGTRSMVYTVKRFHGAYTFTADSGIFSSRFVLNV